MKEKPTDLDRLLQDWKVTAVLPPRFDEGVWKRIERANVPAISLRDAIRAWFEVAFARPAFAVAYVGILLVAGLALGGMQASKSSLRLERELEARYVQAIDPYQRSH